MFGGFFKKTQIETGHKPSKNFMNLQIKEQ